MSIFKKNILVGLTAMLGLVLLGVMVVLFGDAPAKLFAAAQQPLTLSASRADGLSEGSPILYRGVNVGRVISVRLASDQQKVFIDAMVNQKPPLPANVQGIIRSQLIGGSSYVALQLPPETGPQGRLLANATLEASFVGIDILPPEFGELAADLRKLSQQIRSSNFIEHLDQTVVTTRDQIAKVGKVADGVQEVVVEVRKIVSDPKMRKDLQQSIDNFRAATETAREVADNLNHLTRTATTMVSHTQDRIDDLSRQMGDRLQQVAKILDDLHGVSSKLNGGEGTAAKLLNDPKLYESLLDTSRSLDLTIKDLHRLVEQWEQEGVSEDEVSSAAGVLTGGNWKFRIANRRAA